MDADTTRQRQLTSFATTAAAQRLPDIPGTNNNGQHGTSLIDPYRVWFFKMNSLRPLRNLHPEVLLSRIEDHALGYIKQCQMLWWAMMKRDDTLQIVIPKRKAALGRKTWQIQITEGCENDPEAKKQKDALKYFYSNLRVSHAVEQNFLGGVSLLAKQMIEAVGTKWVAHEIIWKQSGGGVTAMLNQVPMWFFEARTGKLRFLPTDTSWDGVDLDERGWMVTMGDGIMEACSWLYLLKIEALQDWRLYSLHCGTPGLAVTTKAPVNSEIWKKYEDAVALLQGGAAMVFNDEKLEGGMKQIEKIDLTADGQIPMPEIVDFAERGLAALWRGGDLSTKSATAGDAGQGASVQEGETDNIEEDDCQLVSETCQLQLDQLVLKIVFGEDVEAKAYFSYGGAGKVDTVKEMAIDTGLYNMGVAQHAHDLATRYGRELPDGEEGTIIVKQAAPAPMPGQPGDETFDQTRSFADAIANEDPKQKALIAAATKELAKAQAKVLKPIRDRLAYILALSNEESMAQELARFRADLPTLLLKVNANPATAKELEKLIGAAMVNGVAQGKESKANEGNSEGAMKGWETRRNGAAGLSDEANKATLAHGVSADQNDPHGENAKGDRFSPIRHKELGGIHGKAAEEWKAARDERIKSGEGRKGDSVDKGWSRRELQHRQHSASHHEAAKRLDEMWGRLERKND